MHLHKSHLHLLKEKFFTLNQYFFSVEFLVFLVDTLYNVTGMTGLFHVVMQKESMDEENSKFI